MLIVDAQVRERIVERHPGLKLVTDHLDYQWNQWKGRRCVSRA
jgi:hypothetical protein